MPPLPLHDGAELGKDVQGVRSGSLREQGGQAGTQVTLDILLRQVVGSDNAPEEPGQGSPGGRAGRGEGVTWINKRGVRGDSGRCGPAWEPGTRGERRRPG